MVVPLTPEEDWESYLTGLPQWTPPKVPTLIVAPHPDDETLAVGGLIHHLTRNNVDVSVVAVTDGENAYPDEVGLGPVRVLEQNAALATLGVPPDKIHRLHLRDSGLYADEPRLAQALSHLIQPGMHVIAPWTGDFHPDHEVCGRAAQVAANDRNARLTFYFFWTWHRGTPDTLSGFQLASFPLHSDDVRKKNEALLCHRSQLEHPSGNPILPPHLLAPMHRPFEVLLPA